MTLHLIWAQNERGLIGADGDLPWHIPEDLGHLRTLTWGKSVIMGRATWDSLPEKFRPLPGRRNIVLTRNEKWRADGAEPVASVAAALALVGENETWVMGGGEIYRQFLPFARRCEVTVVNMPEAAGDTYAPPLGPEWQLASQDPELGWHLSKSSIQYRFESHTRIDVKGR